LADHGELIFPRQVVIVESFGFGFGRRTAVFADLAGRVAERRTGGSLALSTCRVLIFLTALRMCRKSQRGNAKSESDAKIVHAFHSSILLFTLAICLKPSLLKHSRPNSFIDSPIPPAQPHRSGRASRSGIRRCCDPDARLQWQCRRPVAAPVRDRDFSRVAVHIPRSWSERCAGPAPSPQKFRCATPVAGGSVRIRSGR